MYTAVYQVTSDVLMQGSINERRGIRKKFRLLKIERLLKFLFQLWKFIKNNWFAPQMSEANVILKKFA